MTDSTRERIETLLVELQEYWNGNRNDGAMQLHKLRGQLREMLGLPADEEKTK